MAQLSESARPPHALAPLVDTAESLARSPAYEPPTHRFPRQGDITIAEAYSLIRRNLRLLASCSVAGALLAASVALVMPRHFTSEASFMPQVKQQAGLSGLAAQLGVSLPPSEVGQSPQFYADLLHSPKILEQAVQSRYRVASAEAQDGRSLVDIYGARGATARARIQRAAAKLSEALSASVSPKTGVVTLGVTASSPELAQQIDSVLLSLVDDFNVRVRTTQAGQERKFTEARASELKAELAAAEDRLEQFRQQNRFVQDSPELQLQLDRLTRDVALRQQIYASVAQAYEQARIEEVRDTPVITVVSPPEIPATPDPRGLVQKAILGFLAGVAAAAGYLVLGKQRGRFRALLDA